MPTSLCYANAIPERFCHLRPLGKLRCDVSESSRILNDFARVVVTNITDALCEVQSEVFQPAKVALSCEQILVGCFIGTAVLIELSCGYDLAIWKERALDLVSG